MVTQCTTNMNLLQANATLLLSGGLVVLILLACFPKDARAHKAPRIFFYTLLFTLLATVLYAFHFLRHTHPHDSALLLCTSLSYLCVYIAEYLYLRYVAANVQMRRKQPLPPIALYLALLLCLVSAGLQFVSFFNANTAVPLGAGAYANIFFWLGHLGEWVLLLLTLIILLRYREMFGRRQIIVLLFIPLLLFLATLAEPLAGGMILRYPALIAGLLIIYTQYHQVREQATQGNDVIKLQNRLLLAAGRMKPHYVYNIMTNIHYLCEMDVEQAQGALGTFSDYLRKTLETVENEDMVSFGWELDQVKNYLSLEKMRFGDRLNLDYDIDVDDFDVPPLCIMPLAENAVKHGIMGLDRPGTVRIVTRRIGDNGVQIRVIDDGVGFDVTQNKEAGHTLAAVEERLRDEAGGEITITSAPGEGTTVTIILRHPRREASKNQG